MALTKTEKIENLKKEIAELQNQQKRLIQEQKAQERKDRTKRLCRRMGLFESLLPETITLTDDLFKIFLEKAILTENTRRILDGLTRQTAATPATPSAGSAARGIPTPAGQLAHTKRDEDADEGQDGGNGARVTG